MLTAIRIIVSIFAGIVVFSPLTIQPKERPVGYMLSALIISMVVLMWV